MEFKEFFINAEKKYKISYFDLAYVIEKVLKLDRLGQLKKENISIEEIDKVTKILEIYKNGKPLNKIFEEQNFYGMNFYINENVLAPRSETEILVEKAIDIILGENKLKVLDICTGSGCIGLTIKANCPNAIVTMSDISKEALEVAEFNKKKFSLDVEIIESDLFNDISKQKFDLIVSNPPYIKNDDKENISKEVLLYDPSIALFGGDDGLKYYREILENSKDYLKSDGIIIFEIGYDISKESVILAQSYGYEVEVVKDYNKIDRILILRRK